MQARAINMGRGLYIATLFSCGLAIYLGATKGYLNPNFALVALVIWVLIMRKVASPSTEQLAAEISRQHQADKALAAGKKAE